MDCHTPAPTLVLAELLADITEAAHTIGTLLRGAGSGATAEVMEFGGSGGRAA